MLSVRAFRMHKTISFIAIKREIFPQSEFMTHSNFRERADTLDPIRKVYPSDKTRDAELLVAPKRVRDISAILFVYSENLHNFNICPGGSGL